MKQSWDLLYLTAAPRLVERLSLPELPAALRQQLRALRPRDDRYAARFLLHGGLLLAGAALAAVAALPALRLLGATLEVVGLVGLSVGVHEASHGSLLRRRWANELAGFLCGVPLLLPVSAFRTNHLDHHRRRGCGARPTPEVLDFALLRSLPAYSLGVAAKSFGFLTVLPVLALAKSRGRVRLRTIGEYAAMLTILYAVHARVGGVALLRLWLIPLAVTGLCSQVRAVAEHGLTSKGNTFTASRTVTSGKLVSFLMCNINYHLEHHLCPNLPWYRLPAAHRLLAEAYQRSGASVYGSYRQFFADFLRATWRGVRPERRLIALQARSCS